MNLFKITFEILDDNNICSKIAYVLDKWESSAENKLLKLLNNKYTDKNNFKIKQIEYICSTDSDDGVTII